MTTTVSMDPRLRARRVEVLRVRGRRRLRGLLVLAVLGVLAVAGWWLAHSPLFDVDEVAVTGTERMDPAAVLDVVPITEGEPLVEVDLAAAEAAVAELPWVDSVSAGRGVDGTVTVAITEREPVAAVPGSSGWMLVDRDGRVLEMLDGLPGDVVVVDGPVWQAEPGGWIGERALPALELATLLPASLDRIVSTVELTDEGMVLALFGGGRIWIGDETELDDKFLAALTMIEQVPLGCLDRIDVRAPRVPVLTRLAECS